MKNLKTYENFVNEGRTDYWPGYDSDSVFDTLSTVRKKTSKIQNTELRKLEKKLLNVPLTYDNGSVRWTDENHRDFWQKHFWAELVSTSIQDGFYIDRDLAEMSLQYYKDSYSNANKSIYLEDSLEEFNLQTVAIIKEFEIKLKDSKREYVYGPGFMDRQWRKGKNIPEYDLRRQHRFYDPK